MYGYNNPYMPNMGNMPNPYQNNRTFQNDYGRQEITRVNGENGAKAYSMGPNSSILLLDETAPIVWLAQTDGAGYKTITPYSITPYQAAPSQDYSNLEARIKRLEDMINESNNANVKSQHITESE